MNESSRGFSLLELLVAAAIAIVMGFFCVRLATGVLGTFTAVSARDAASMTVARLHDAFTNDEDDAWAIFTPPSDVNGNNNGDGHEIDFFSRDAKHADTFWAYDYSASSKTLTRYTYARPGGAPVLEETFGGITSFYARTYPLTALNDASSAIYSPWAGGADLQNGAVEFFPSTAPWIQGGNAITYVKFTAPLESREMHLSTWTAPSGYVVVLNYTPRPSPTPSDALAVWPPAAMLPESGQTLGAVSYAAPKFTYGLALNAMLGGGIAQAAGYGACPNGYARAYSTAYDANLGLPFPTADVIASQSDPWGAGVSTDANGCWNGTFVLHDANATSFRAVTPTCSVRESQPSDISAGLAAVTVSGQTTPTSSPCQLPFTDSAMNSGYATVAVMCQPDSYGYCPLVVRQVTTSSGGGTGRCQIPGVPGPNGGWTTPPRWVSYSKATTTTNTTYFNYGPALAFEGAASDAQVTSMGGGGCPPEPTTTDTWSPWEPSQHFNDPNLP